MSSDIETGDISTDVAKGATKAILEFSAEKIKTIIERFKNRDVAFVGNIDVIELVKFQRQSAEWKQYSRWIKDSRLRILLQMGIALRKIENDNAKLIALKDKIHAKYGSSGLHVAEFTQNRILGKYIESILATAQSDEEIGQILQEFLNHLERLCAFIKSTDNAEQKINEFRTRMYSLVPKLFIIHGYGSAILILDKIINGLIPTIPDYTIEEYKENNRKIVFFNRKND